MRKVVLVILCALLPFGVFAERRYVVKKGDTLWDISAKFLESPFLWELIWETNRNIVENPHWIFPGQVITIPEGERKEIIETEKKEKTVSQRPVFGSESLIFVHYITEDLPEVLGRLEADIYDKDKTLFSRGDLVAVKLLKPLDVGKKYLVFRTLGRFKDPFTGRPLGFYVANVGIVKVRRLKGSYAVVQVLKSTTSLLSGDSVTFFEIPRPIYRVGPPSKRIRARVVGLTETKASADLFDMVFIDAGKSSGIKRGDLLFAFEEPWRTVVGELVVIRVEEKTSTCLVTAVKRILSVGDTVGVWEESDGASR